MEECSDLCCIPALGSLGLDEVLDRVGEMGNDRCVLLVLVSRLGAVSVQALERLVSPACCS